MGIQLHILHYSLQCLPFVCVYLHSNSWSFVQNITEYLLCAGSGLGSVNAAVDSPSVTWSLHGEGGRRDVRLQITLYISLVMIAFLKLIYFWLHWVFTAACGLSLIAVPGFIAVTSPVEHGLSSDDAWA